MNHSSRRKIRADLLLVERELAESRERAQALIMEGLVFSPSGRVCQVGLPAGPRTWKSLSGGAFPS